MIKEYKIGGRITGLFYFVLILTFSFSCSQSNQETSLSKKDYISFGDLTSEINMPDKDQNIKLDSLLALIFKYGETYYNINSIDSIISLHGKPSFVKKSRWGISIDTLVTIGYPKLRFDFVGNSRSKFRLAAIDYFDNDFSFAKRISIGNTTRDEILQIMGLPDYDHNDPGRTITKSGDTTVYGTQSGAGDTVTFIYYFDQNYDEYSIGLSMTKDTLRKVSWNKNLL